MSIIIQPARFTEGKRNRIEDSSSEESESESEEYVPPRDKNNEAKDNETIMTAEKRHFFYTMWSDMRNNTMWDVDKIVDPYVFPLRHPKTFFLAGPPMSEQRKSEISEITQTANKMGNGSMMEVYRIPGTRRILRRYKERLQIYSQKSLMRQFFFELAAMSYIGQPFVPEIYSFGSFDGYYFLIEQNAGELFETDDDNKLILTEKQESDKKIIESTLRDSGFFIMDNDKPEQWMVDDAGQLRLVDLNGLMVSKKE